MEQTNTFLKISSKGKTIFGVMKDLTNEQVALLNAFVVYDFDGDIESPYFSKIEKQTEMIMLEGELTGIDEITEEEYKVVESWPDNSVQIKLNSLKAKVKSRILTEQEASDTKGNDEHPKFEKSQPQKNTSRTRHRPAMYVDENFDPDKQEDLQHGELAPTKPIDGFFNQTPTEIKPRNRRVQRESQNSRRHNFMHNQQKPQNRNQQKAESKPSSQQAIIGTSGIKIERPNKK